MIQNKVETGPVAVRLDRDLEHKAGGHFFTGGMGDREEKHLSYICYFKSGTFSLEKRKMKGENLP